jgi:hypothetical protein
MIVPSEDSGFSAREGAHSMRGSENIAISAEKSPICDLRIVKQSRSKRDPSSLHGRVRGPILSRMKTEFGDET